MKLVLACSMSFCGLFLTLLASPSYATSTNECSAVHAHIIKLQTRAGLTPTEQSDFAQYGQIRPHDLRKEPLAKAIDALTALKGEEKHDGLSAYDIGRLIHDRQKELSATLQKKLEALVSSRDSEKVGAALRALEGLKNLDENTQAQIASLIEDPKHASNAIDVLEKVGEVSVLAFDKVSRLAAANARAGKTIWFTGDPERLLRRITPAKQNKDQALRSAGLSDVEIANFNRSGKIQPKPIAELEISALVGLLVQIEPGQKFEGSPVRDIGRLVRDRHAELNPKLQTEVEKLLQSSDADKVNAVLDVLETVKTISPAVQMTLVNLLANKTFASNVVDVFEKHNTTAPAAYQAIAQLARANAIAGKKIWFTEDPERLLRRLKPEGLAKDEALKAAGLTPEERKDFDQFGEIRPHSLKKAELSQAVDVLARLQ